MKVIRLLVYEGTEEMLEKHFSQTFLNPGRPFLRSDLDIREIFRGEQKSEVTYLDEDVPF